MRYTIELLDRYAKRQPLGTAFGHLTDATRFAMRLADDLRDPESLRATQFGPVAQVLVRRANITEMAITVFRI